MNWEVIGAVSELVGAAVVIITLLYAARQIHQVNVQGQASARYSFIEAYGQMNMSISGSKEVASLFRRGFKGEQLKECHDISSRISPLSCRCDICRD